MQGHFAWILGLGSWGPGLSPFLGLEAMPSLVTEFPPGRPFHPHYSNE